MEITIINFQKKIQHHIKSQINPSWIFLQLHTITNSMHIESIIFGQKKETFRINKDNPK